MRTEVLRLLKWRTAIGELAIIVIGVLVALAVNSWWDGRMNRRSEREHLQALKVDYEQNLAGLRGTIARVDSLKSSTLVLISVVEGTRPPPPVDSIVQLTWMSFGFAPFAPLTTAYDNLLSSGGIELLRNEDLKRNLAMFKAQVEALWRQDWVLDQWNRIIQPWAVENLNLDWLAPEYRAKHAVPEPTVNSDWSAILADREFKGIVINRLIALTDYMAGLEPILPTAEAIVQQLAH